MIRKLVAGFVTLLLPLLLNAADVSPDLAKRTALNFFLEKAAQKNPGSFPGTLDPELIPYTLEGELVYYFARFPQKGFVVVAGDDSCTPVLAWSFRPVEPGDEMPEACKAWFDWYAGQVLEVKRNNLEAGAGIAGLWSAYGQRHFEPHKSLIGSGVGPLTVSEWGQRYYYNNLCPPDPAGPGGHAIAGCVATAMAQVLFYYRYPVHGEGSNGYMSNYGYEYVDFEEAEYRWDEMVSVVYGAPNPEIAELIYHVGVSVEMNYGPSSSGALTEETVDALKNHFRYDEKLHYISKFNLGEAFRDSVIACLNQHRIMIYRGGSMGSSHSFVCDGYQDSTYFHFNWGWDGSYNGYYAMENLNPNIYDFTFDQGAVINIYPRENYPEYCQAGKIFSASRGTFADGSGPETYPPGLGCSFLISPEDPDITNIMVWFTQFDLHNGGGDLVSLYDGPTENSPLIGQYAGEALPPLVVSTGNELLVVFETDGSGVGQGWQTEYLAYPGPFCNPLSPMTAMSQNYFTDGSGPYNYTDLSDCGWLINPQDDAFDSVSSINLWFHQMDLGQGDTLFIHDGPDYTAPVMEKITGSEMPGNLQSTGNKLYLSFISDEHINAGGWAAGYSSNLPVYCSDTLVYIDNTGIIDDGSGDKKYVPNTTCHWLIETENAQMITVEFLEFDLEYGYDQLKFYDASKTPALHLATFWGHDLPAMQSWYTDRILIKFASDGSEEFGGWKLKYTALAPGIDETDLSARLILFPNPAGDKVFVELCGLQDQKIGMWIFDATMCLVRQEEIVFQVNSQSEIDVSALKPGIYILLFRNEKSRFFSKLVIH